MIFSRTFIPHGFVRVTFTLSSVCHRREQTHELQYQIHVDVHTVIVFISSDSERSVYLNTELHWYPFVRYKHTHHVITTCFSDALEQERLQCVCVCVFQEGFSALSGCSGWSSSPAAGTQAAGTPSRPAAAADPAAVRQHAPHRYMPRARSMLNTRHTLDTLTCQRHTALQHTQRPRRALQRHTLLHSRNTEPEIFSFCSCSSSNFLWVFLDRVCVSHSLTNVCLCQRAAAVRTLK